MRVILALALAVSLGGVAAGEECWSGRSDLLTPRAWTEIAGQGVEIEVSSAQDLRSVFGRVVFVDTDDTSLVADLPFMHTEAIGTDGPGRLDIAVPAELQDQLEGTRVLICAQIVTFADGSRQMF